MKDERSLRGSMRARRKDARKIAARIVELIDRHGDALEGQPMTEIRACTAELCQAVHEFNAYRNALVTP